MRAAYLYPLPGFRKYQRVDLCFPLCADRLALAVDARAHARSFWYGVRRYAALACARLSAVISASPMAAVATSLHPVAIMSAVRIP